MLFSDTKIFHFQEKVNSLPREEKLLPPVHIRIKPTNRCNHRCRYCIFRDKRTHLGGYLCESDTISQEKMAEITHDIIELGVRAVTFSGGGEPLLYPYIIEAAQALIDGGVKIGCYSNGSFLNGKRADFFAHNATWLRVSMDGWDNASYFEYRGVKGKEYTKILNNLEAFSKKNGKCKLGVVYNIDAQNYMYLPEIISRIQATGAASIKISAVVAADSVEEQRAYHAPHFQAVSEFIFQAREQYASSDFEIQDTWSGVTDSCENNYSWCPYMQVVSVIGADLGLYSCPNKTYTESGRIGSLKEQRFKDFWTGDKAPFFRISPVRDCYHRCNVHIKNIMLLDYFSINSEHGVFV